MLKKNGHPRLNTFAPGSPLFWSETKVIYGNNLFINNYKNESFRFSEKSESLDGKIGKTKRIIAEKEIEGVARRIGAYAYLENSALCEEGIEEVFQTAARSALRKTKNRKHFLGIFNKIK